MPFRIEVDREACIGCGACEAVCPDYFKLVEGKSVPLRKEVEDLSCAKDAEDGCPVDAIKVSGTG